MQKRKDRSRKSTAFLMGLWWTVFGLAVFSCQADMAHSAPGATYKVNCEGTRAAWKEDPSLKDFLNRYDCYCVSQDQHPVCTPKGGGGTQYSSPKSGYKHSGKSGYGGKQGFQMQMFQGLLGVFMKGIMQGSSAPSEPETRNVKITLSPEEQARIKAHMEKMQNEYKKMKEGELQKELASLKKGMKGREGPSAQGFGEGYPGKAFSQLNCSAYWGIKAARSALSVALNHSTLDGPDEFARAFGEYAAQGAGTGQGGCPEVKTDIPDISQGPDTLRTDMFEFIIAEIDVIIPEVKVLQERSNFAKSTIAAKQDEIKELEARLASTAGKEDTEKLDALMQDAMNVLQEAQAEDAKVTEEFERNNQKLKALQKMYGYYQ